MTPPRAICSVPDTRANPISSDPSPQEFLRLERLFCDSSNPDNPTHWAQEWDSGDSSFRLSPENRPLFFALHTLENYFAQESSELSDDQIQSLTDWLLRSNRVDLRSLDQAVLQNLQQTLSQVSGEYEEHAQMILAVIGWPEAPPASAEPARVAEPAEEVESAPPTDPDEFRISAVTGSFRSDSFNRDVLNTLTIDAIPTQGVPGFNQSAAAGLSLGLEAQAGKFTLFTELALNLDVTPAGAPASRYHQGFAQFGLARYPQRNTGDGLHAGFGGRERVGLGLGLRFGGEVTGEEGEAGATPPKDVLQFTAFTDSDFFHVGYGPMEMGMRFLSNPIYYNLGDSILPSMNNMVPFELSLTYHLTPPQSKEGSGMDSDITKSDAVFDALRIGAITMRNQMSYLQEAAMEQTRVLIALGAFGLSSGEAQYGLTNLGSFLGSTLVGVREGGLAYSLRRDLAGGDTTERLIVGIPMAAEFLLQGGMFLAHSGDADEATGVPTLESEAHTIGIAQLGFRDGLTILGAVGALGNRDEAMEMARNKQFPLHFGLAHGGVSLLGLGLILGSGDGTGEGFGGNTIIGNSYPLFTDTEITETRLSLASQRMQYLKSAWGSTLLTYGVNGVLDLIGNWNQPASEASEDPETAQASGSNLRVSFDTDGSSYGMATLSGNL